MTVTENASNMPEVRLSNEAMVDTPSTERFGPGFSPKKTVYSPMSFCLVGALFGILCDAILAPGPLFWILFFF